MLSRFLCIAAHSEAIPMAVIPSGEGIDTLVVRSGRPERVRRTLSRELDADADRVWTWSLTPHGEGLRSGFDPGHARQSR